MSTSTRRSYRFLLSRRWAGLFVLMVAFCVTCVLLGQWQWGRYETRSAAADQVEAAHDADPVPLTEALDGTGVRASDAWRPVELTGEYLADATVLLRNRPVDGTPAVHVLAPFLARTAEGDVTVVVDRGWLPAEQADAAADPVPPAGEVTVTGRLRVAEGTAERTPPPGQVYAIDPAQVLAAGQGSAQPGTVLDGYVELAAEEPAGAVELGTYPRPSFSWGVNLSYAIQWWIFAVGGVVAVVVLARREAADHARHDGTAAPAREGRAPRRRTAEEEEDAIVDAQLGG